MSQTPVIEYAQLEWDEQGLPFSSAYGDIYFSRDDGLEETRVVFLENNHLPERFAALQANDNFVIAETGFGTGMNFLCAWQLFNRQAPASARLHFISVEKYPLSPDDLKRALALWPELVEFSEPLLGQYVAIHPGFQRIKLAGGRVVLDLLIGDGVEMFSQLDARVDAWFLDGFAPGKNPRLWSPELFEQVARLSVTGTSFGTFSSAGVVRRALKEAGFTVKRVPGIGKKWEFIKGEFAGESAAVQKPWFARPVNTAKERHALVIGAGLAGCATAASLAQRGWKVTLLERHSSIAAEASGNPQGVLYLKLSAHGTALSRLIVSGFGYTRRQLERLNKGLDWDNCGVLQLAFDDKEAQRQAKIAQAFPQALVQNISQSQAETIAGVKLESGGLYYPQAGWVHPPALCQSLCAQANITLQLHQDALQLKREDGLWQARNSEQLLASAEVVVLAGAADIKQFEYSAELPLKRIRGQITRLLETVQSAELNTVICAEGYVAPARDGEHTLGASFDFNSNDLTANARDHAGNIELLEAISSDLSQRLNAHEYPAESLQGRAAFRCTSPDYLPIVGPLADLPAFADAYAILSKDARQVPDIKCPWLPGLYINSGHGSRGLITAPLSGEMIAAWLNDEPLPVPRDVAEGCHPNRFALRKLVRNL